MKKNIYIFIFIFFSLLIFLFSYNYFTKGMLNLNVEPKESNVLIDKKTYLNASHISVRLNPGKHSIKVSKESYEDYSTTINIEKGKTTKKQIKLTKSDEKITQASSDFIASLNTYTFKEPDKYLSSFQNKVTPDFFQDLKNRYSIPKDIRPEETENYSKVTIIESRTDIASSTMADSTVVAEIEKLDKPIKDIPLQLKIKYSLTLKNVNNQWLVSEMSMEEI